MMSNGGTRAFLMMAFFLVQCVSACAELSVPSAYANRQMSAMHFIEYEPLNTSFFFVIRCMGRFRRQIIPIECILRFACAKWISFNRCIYQ